MSIETSIYAEGPEMSVLGGMLIFPKTIAQVRQILPIPLMYYHPAHRLIAEAIYGLADRAVAVDVVSVVRALDVKGKMPNIGGEDYLIQIMELVPSPSNAIHYANSVREAYALRHYSSRAQEVLNAISAGEDYPTVHNLVQGMNRGRLMPSQHVFELSDPPSEGVDEYMEGLPTGIREIDQLTSMGGIPIAQLTTIGAYTGHGKSFMLQQIVRNVAERGERCAYMCFGADLNEKMLRMRWIKQATGIMPHRHMTDSQREIVREESERLSKLSVAVYEAEQAEDATVETAMAWAESAHKSNPFALIVADYGQVMETKERCMGEKERGEIIAKRISDLPAKLKTAVVVASQMQDETSLSFRYSQQWKHSSGLGLVFQRKPPELMDGRTEIKATVVKNRWGYEGGEWFCHWNPRHTRFEFAGSF